MWDLPHLGVQCTLKVLTIVELEEDSSLKVEHHGITLFDTMLNLQPDYIAKHPFLYPPGETYTSKLSLNNLTMQAKTID